MNKQAVLKGKQGPQNTVERWQGPPHINKVKQYEIVLSFQVILFIQPWERRELVSMKIFFFWLNKMSSHYAVPL